MRLQKEQSMLNIPVITMVAIASIVTREGTETIESFEAIEISQPDEQRFQVTMIKCN